MLYSYKKQIPSELPFRITLDNGLTLTEVNTFTTEKLKEFGFTGPFEIPNYDSTKQKISWIDQEFVVEDFSSDEIERMCKKCKDNYLRFFELFYSSDLCKIIEEKNQYDNALKIHYLNFKILELNIANSFEVDLDTSELFIKHINIFYNSYEISDALKEDLKNLLIDSNLDVFINKIITIICNFSSWPLQEDGITRKAPLPYPTDGKEYEWDEDAYQADNTKGWLSKETS
jgi:hypothetical protein